LIQLERQNGVDEKWTVHSICKRLQEYVIARERASKGTYIQNDKTRSSLGAMNNKSFNHGKHNSFGKEIQKSSTQSLISMPSKLHLSKKTADSHKKRCRYCEKDHWSDECCKYKTISERKNHIKGSCFKCLKEGHLFKDCKTNKVCVYCGELNIHHRSLCPKKFGFKSTVTSLSTEINESGSQRQENGLLTMNEMVLMQTALTEIKNPARILSQQVRLLFDSGSQRSYISEKLAHRLCLQEEGEHDIHVVTFGNQKAKTIKTKYTTLQVKLMNGKFMQISVNIVPLISGEMQRRPIDELSCDKVNEILSSVQLADDLPRESEISPIEVLIGNDYYLDFVNGEKIEVQEGLYLLASKFGWILSGRTKDRYNESYPETSMLILTQSSCINKTNVFTTIDSSMPSKTELEDFWNIESIGIVDKHSTSDDDIAMEHFKETLIYNKNRYSVTWPWKSDCPDLPTNRELALGRLRSVVNRMKGKPETLQKYDNVIQEQFNKGIIEKVITNENDGVVHYLPHHCVITPQKTTTKLRV
jgi:hypothetical protein